MTNAEVKEVMATKMSVVHPLHVGITGIIGIGDHPGVEKKKLSFPQTKMTKMTKILKDPSSMTVQNLILSLSPRMRMLLLKNAVEKGTIHVLRKHFYSTKFNLNTDFFSKTFFLS